MCWQFSRNIKPICCMEAWTFMVNVGKIYSSLIQRIWEDRSRYQPHQPPASIHLHLQATRLFELWGWWQLLLGKNEVLIWWIHWFLWVGVFLAGSDRNLIVIVRLVYFTDITGRNQPTCKMNWQHRLKLRNKSDPWSWLYAIQLSCWGSLVRWRVGEWTLSHFSEMSHTARFVSSSRSEFRPTGFSWGFW